MHDRGRPARFIAPNHEMFQRCFFIRYYSFGSHRERADFSPGQRMASVAVSRTAGVTPEFRAFLEELLEGFGQVEIRRVFNFDGLYRESTMFGLVTDGRVFLKTDEQSRTSFQNEDAEPLRYRGRDGTDVVTSYYEIPARLLDDPGEAAAWARRAYEIALGSPTALLKQRKRRKSARKPARKRSRS